MLSKFVKFSGATTDLPRIGEYWQSATYAMREKEIIEYIVSRTGCPPSPNMIYIREGRFAIKPETTLTDVLTAASLIRQGFHIDCFQVAIDRESQTAHLLFDWYDRSRLACVVLQHNHHKVLTALLLRALDVPQTKDMAQYARYFIQAEYQHNRNVFRDILTEVKRKRLSKHNYRIIQDILTYIELKQTGQTK